jgi:hypothetical protein
VGRSSAKLLALGGSAALIAGLLAPAAATAAPAPAAAPQVSFATTKAMPLPRGFWSVGFLDVIDKGAEAFECIQNMSQGKACGGIQLEQIDAKLDQVLANMETNQRELRTLLGGLQDTLNSVATEQQKQRLVPIEANMPGANAAWDAIVKCQQAATECKAYEGALASKATPKAEAVRATSRWLRDNALNNMPADIATVSTEFRKFIPLLWKEVKGRYDNSVEATAAGKGSAKTRVVTHVLSEAWNSSLEKYLDLMYLYGFFVPMMTTSNNVELVNKPEDRQKAAKTHIFGTLGSSTTTVRATGQEYQLPSVPKGNIVFFDGDKAWKIKLTGGTRPLEPADMFGLSNAMATSGYLPSKLRPDETSFNVQRPIFERGHPYYTNNLSGKKVAICPSWFGAGGCGAGDAPKTISYELSTCTPGTSGTLAGNRCIKGVVKMTATDKTQTWADEEKRIVARYAGGTTLYTWTYGTWYKGSDSHGYFNDGWTSFVTGPAVYEWEELRFYQDFIGASADAGKGIVGPGIYVKHLNPRAYATIKVVTRDGGEWVPDLMK